jgi:RNA recognition motif. (a.k.a. RRM, RBD, or RNP domain)
VQAIKVLNMIKVYGKPIRVNKASQEKKALDVGANLFIGNLDPDVDEKMLYDTFSAFGVIVATPKIMRDPDSGTNTRRVSRHPRAARACSGPDAVERCAVQEYPRGLGL